VSKIVVVICFMGFVILLSFLLGFDALSIIVMKIQLNVPHVLIYRFILVIYLSYILFIFIFK